MEIDTFRYKQAAAEIQRTMARAETRQAELAPERRERRLSAIAHLDEAQKDRANGADPRTVINKAFSETIDEDRYQMGKSRSCPDPEIGQMWAAKTGESFAVSAAHFFLERVAAFRAEPAFYTEAEIKPFRREAYAFMSDVGVREAWHLAYFMGISPEDYKATTGESFEQTKAKHYFWKVAKRHAKGETIIWSETNGAIKNGQSKDMDLLEALVNAAAAGVKTEEDLPKIMGITGREWKRRTGHAFIPLAGKMRQVGSMRRASGSTEEIRTFYLDRPVSYAPACTHG